MEREPAIDAAVPTPRPLDEFVADCRASEGVALDWFEPGTALVVETRNSRYRLLVLDGPKRHVVVQGGSMFSEATPVRLEGATAGGALKLGWILIGFSLQLMQGLRRIRTSSVRSITVDHLPSATGTQFSGA
jgi:hypothetical protein